MEKTKSAAGNNYEETITESLFYPQKRGVFLALYGSGKNAIGSGDLIDYVGDVSLAYPLIEEMTKDGIVESDWRKIEEGGSEKTYKLKDDFYKACQEFNGKGNKII